MKRVVIVIFAFLRVSNISQQVDKVADPVEWINPLMGSESSYELSPFEIIHL